MYVYVCDLITTSNIFKLIDMILPYMQNFKTNNTCRYDVLLESAFKFSGAFLLCIDRYDILYF